MSASTVGTFDSDVRTEAHVATEAPQERISFMSMYLAVRLTARAGAIVSWDTMLTPVGERSNKTTQMPRLIVTEFRGRVWRLSKQ